MLLSQVKRTIDRYHLLDKGDRLIVGVSGGMDSMVLLFLLNAFRQEFDLSLIVAHINHGLRPDESEKEAELVLRESEKLGFPFEYEKFDVKEFQRAGGLSIQDAARRVRFHFFNSLLKKHSAQKIALGHHADDQVETLLLRLIRGSGLQGLKGMLPIREGRVIHPLIEVWRKEIESFARERGIPHFLDSSNVKANYLRNRIRLSLIPLIERDYQPKFKSVIIRTSALLKEEDDYLDKEAEEVFQKIIQEKKEAFSFRFSEYQSLHRTIQRRLIQKFIGKIYHGEGIMEEGKGVAIEFIFKRLSQSSPSFLIELPHGISFEKRYDRVFLRKEWVKPIPPFEVELNRPGSIFVDDIGKKVIVEEIDKGEIVADLKGSSTTAFLDDRSLLFPLKMRNFRPGDRFQPLGVKGTQKLKKYFIDHKIPRFERPKIPLLVSGEMIVWIVGYRIDERVKVTEKTRKVVKIEVIDKNMAFC